MNPSVPTFSVVVPVYNHAPYIGAALDSIRAQECGDWEAVVVDDGSTDETPAIVDAYPRQDPRFRVIHKPNGGVAEALNDGIRNARGRWICWLSSDDLFDRTKLAVHLEWIERHPDCRFFFSNFRALESESGLITDGCALMPVPELRWPLLEMLEVGYINGIATCIRRDVFSEVGLFDALRGYAQDYDMWLRILARCRVVHIPSATCTYRRHAAQGMTLQPDRAFFDAARAAIDFLNAHRLPDFAPELQGADADGAGALLERAVDIAANPFSFVYALGPHPGLILRIMEWLWADDPPRAHRDLRRAFGWRARAAAYALSPGHLRLLWKMAAAASDLQDLRVAWRPLDPVAVAQHHFWASTNDARVQALPDYAGRYLGLSLPTGVPGGGGVVRDLLLDGAGADSAEAAVFDAARLRYVAGFVAPGTAQLEAAGPTLRLSAPYRWPLFLALSGVAPFDGVVAAADSPLRHWPLGAQRVLRPLGGGGCALSGDGGAPMSQVSRAVLRVLQGAVRLNRVARRRS